MPQAVSTRVQDRGVDLGLRRVRLLTTSHRQYILPTPSIAGQIQMDHWYEETLVFIVDVDTLSTQGAITTPPWRTR